MTEQFVDAAMPEEAPPPANREAIATQRQLPLPWNLSRVGGGGDRFAHPAEAELGRILAYYGVSWSYTTPEFRAPLDGG